MPVKHRLLVSGVLTIALATTFFNLVSCGGGTARSVLDRPEQQAAPVVADPGPPARNVLTTTMPALGTLRTGAEFEFVVNCELAEELFQASARVLYDPQVVQPLRAERGALIPAADTYLCRPDLPLGTLQSPLERLPGVIPFAFTGQPGEAGIPPGRGELLRIRFRITGTPRGGCVQLQNDDAYLQLRNAQGHRLGFDLATEEVSR